VALVVTLTVTVEQANDVVDSLELPYPIYADPSWELNKAYETGFVMGAPMPAWVVIDGEGTIRYLWRAHDQAMGTNYPEADQILAELRRLGLGTAK
jgi:peroxiredoxin